MQTLPKIELHLHLDCSLSYEAVSAIDPAFTPPRYAREIVAPPRVDDLADYLARTRVSVALLQTERALRVAVSDLLQQLAADGVIYAEIRFAPLLHTDQGLSPENVVRIVVDEADHACARTGVDTRLILCTLRHFSEEQDMVTARLIERFRGSRVVALDLAGDEAGFPLDAHVPAFTFARRHGILCTAHAGEASGPASVRGTLVRLKPSRIGHGVRSIDDPALVEHLIARDIHLEVCPACNVQIGIYGSYEEHPVDRLYRAGVSLSINTDARAVTPTTLTLDYERLAETFGWTEADFLACNLNAVAASFAPDDVKAELTLRLRAGYAA